MASNSEEVAVNGVSEGEKRRTSKKGKQKKCTSCGGLNPNACKRCKGCGADIKVKMFDWQKLEQKKRTHPTQQRKMLEYRANVLNFHHGWHVVVLCLAKHKRGRSLFTYGTPGSASNLLVPRSRRAQGQAAFVSVFLKGSGSETAMDVDENNADNTEGERNVGNSEIEGNAINSVYDNNNEDNMDNNSIDIDAMEMEYNADVENDAQIDDVALDDVYSRVGLGGVWKEGTAAAIGGGGDRATVLEVMHTEADDLEVGGGSGRPAGGGGVAGGGSGRPAGGGVADVGSGRPAGGGVAGGGSGRPAGGGVAGGGSGRPAGGGVAGGGSGRPAGGGVPGGGSGRPAGGGVPGGGSGRPAGGGVADVGSGRPAGGGVPGGGSGRPAGGGVPGGGSGRPAGGGVAGDGSGRPAGGGVADVGSGRPAGGKVADVGSGRPAGGGVAGGASATVQQGSHGGVASGGFGRATAGGGVAYVIDNKIKAVGKVDHTRSVLHGHKIESGFVCVELSYVQSRDVAAPVILGDSDENSFLVEGMFFALPVSNLYTLGKLGGDKVVLNRFVP
ncbi:hypothetical protein OS493_036519 [Desmophyllum pertusum]|uniref:Uncharacterized protein n=1 Tax=Desmophyllum pertusum TaxID=174260 RepID=A0A9X0D6I8_9CNID|nr:hypothetical protein OS493_036519 [Desmophyllum pertusum]